MNASGGLTSAGPSTRVMSWSATTGASLKKECLIWRTSEPSTSHSVNGWAGPSGLAARNGLNSRFTMAVAALTNPVAMTPTNVWMGLGQQWGSPRPH